MASQIAARFKDAYEALSGQVHLAAGPKEASAVIARIVKEAGATRVALSLDDAALAADIQGACGNGVAVLSEPFAPEGVIDRLDAVEIGVTSAAFAVAEAGALVEFATDDARRLVSTLPRTHIGVLYSKTILETLKESAGLIRTFMETHPTNAAVTFISGPSRTADIEMQLTLGVHGPERAEVVIIGQ